MSKGPLKLAALLKDVADQPETPATSRVSLDVLQDANHNVGLTTEKSTSRWQPPKVVAALTAVILLGGAVAIAVMANSRVEPTPLPIPKTQEASKAAPKEASPSAIDRTAFSPEVKELMQYAGRLRRGEINFAPGITGEEAAKQLGYSRLFASAYEEVKLQVRAREYVGDKVRLEDVISNFATILGEEQQIDQMMQRRDRFSPSIAYLRALQNGDIIFPQPAGGTLKPDALLDELKRLAPNLALVVNDPLFAEIYAETETFSDVLLKETGEVAVYHIISDLRRQIVSHVEAK